MDRVLLGQILGLPKSTPAEALYLEVGCLNIGTIVKMRRINFLHTLLRSNEESTLSQFFQTQLNHPDKDDWTVQVCQDLNDFQIDKNFAAIKSKSKESFKNMVKKHAKDYAFNCLMERKSSHSKLRNISYDELSLQKYLKRQDITVNQAKAKVANYASNYGNKDEKCKLCNNHLDAQEEIYICDYNKRNNITGTYSENKLS